MVQTSCPAGWSVQILLLITHAQLTWSNAFNMPMRTLSPTSKIAILRGAPLFIVAALRGQAEPPFRRDSTKASLDQWTALEFPRKNLHMHISTLDTKKILPERMGIIV
jgi:hypothetical protein